jgi:hypothetical protein
MEEWFVPEHMKRLAKKSTQFFAIDQQGIITYDFNDLGFRTGNNIKQSSINLFGNSISFGIGLNYKQTFGSMVADRFNRKLNNFSFACYLHENHDHLTNLKKIISKYQDDIFIVQINNLDRQRITSNSVLTGNDREFCKKRFLDYFDQISTILKHTRKIFLYWDNVEYDLPKSVTDQILIYNKFHVDTSLLNNSNTFGIKSHLYISKIIVNQLNLT